MTTSANYKAHTGRAYVPTMAHTPWEASGKLVAVLDARAIIEAEGYTSWAGPHL